uniref:Uncharacterized protein n=1 Tax=Trypanosoma vivax (strain Y486) TaxID=1055687 RepID=G0U940_TRYVY|nr:conserved hypothetical protein [Trypanosoma vivax Y486]
MLPFQARKFQPSVPTRDQDNSAWVGEGMLLNTFRVRRKRMEGAMQISSSMLKQVNNVSDMMGEDTAPGIVSEEMGLTQEPVVGAKNPLLEQYAGAIESDEAVVSMGMNHVADASDVMLENEINQKLKNIVGMRLEQRRAAELNMKPAFQSAHSACETEAPPTKFSSNSVTFVLEVLSQSVLKILAATDNIMLELAGLGARSVSVILDEMKTAQLHSQHAVRCYTAAIQHLKQHEVCEKALNEGAKCEVGNTREQFLEQKEVLTTEGQKQKVIEEQLQGLRMRCNTLDTQFRVWSMLFKEMHLSPTAPLTPPPMSTRPPGITPISQRELSCMTVLGRQNSDAATPTLPQTGQRSPAPQPVGNVVGVGGGGGSGGSGGGGGGGGVGGGSSSMTSSAEEGERRIDAVEERVAQFWCNPYVLKSQQCVNRKRFKSNTEDAPPLLDFYAPIYSRTMSIALVDSTTRAQNEVHCVSKGDMQAPNSIDTGGGSAAESRLTILLRGLLRSLSRRARRKTRKIAISAENSGVEAPEETGSEEHVEEGDSVEEWFDGVEEAGEGGKLTEETAADDGGMESTIEVETLPSGNAGGTAPQGSSSSGVSTSDSPEVVSDALLLSVRRLLSYLEGNMNLLS